MDTNNSLVVGNPLSEAPKDLKYIAKKAEYAALLRIIKNHKLAISKRTGYNLLAVARTLDVNPKTLRSWLNTPQIRKALQEEIEFYISKMAEAGRDDWRQWQAQIQLAQGTKDSVELTNIQNNIVIIKDKEKGIFSIGEEEVS